MEQQEFDARPFGRKPWTYERRQGKGLGKPAHYVINDADGRYLGTVVLGNDEDQELVPRTICNLVNAATDAREALDGALAYMETGIKLPAYDVTRAALIAAKLSLNGNGKGGRHA